MVRTVKAWYVIQTASQYEKKVERILRSLMGRAPLKDVLTDIKMPVEKIEEKKEGGKKRLVERKIWPGYLLLELELPSDVWRDVVSVISRIQGVAGFVGHDSLGRPRPISTEEAKKMLVQSGDIKTVNTLRYRNYQDGEEVKIVGGPLAGFQGSIEEIDQERGRVRVAVQILGRSTPVEVEFSHIERS